MLAFLILFFQNINQIPFFKTPKNNKKINDKNRKTNNFENENYLIWWMSWFRKRWRTQWNVISNVNRRSKWIIKILNAYCATLLRFIFATCIWERVEFHFTYWNSLSICFTRTMTWKIQNVFLFCDNDQKTRLKVTISNRNTWTQTQNKETTIKYISLSFKRLTCWTKAFY